MEAKHPRNMSRKEIKNLIKDNRNYQYQNVLFSPESLQLVLLQRRSSRMTLTTVLLSAASLITSIINILLSNS